MKIRKSRIYREPGVIKWHARIPPPTDFRIYIDFTVGDKGARYGPFINPSGTRLPFSGAGKMKLHVEMGPAGFASSSLEKIWIHRHDDILEFGGDAGW